MDFRHLKRLVKGDARLGAIKIASDLNPSLPKPVTTRTVRIYMKELDFEYVVKVKKTNGWVPNVGNDGLLGVQST